MRYRITTSDTHETKKENVFLRFINIYLKQKNSYDSNQLYTFHLKTGLKCTRKNAKLFVLMYGRPQTKKLGCFLQLNWNDSKVHWKQRNLYHSAVCKSAYFRLSLPTLQTAYFSLSLLTLQIAYFSLSHSINNLIRFLLYY